MSLLTFAAKAKGPIALIKRAYSIANHYGGTPYKMDRALDLFSRILGQFDCGASFPLTAVTLSRNPGTIVKYLDRHVEFLVHGYVHIDHTQLAPEEQLVHLQRARAVFADSGIEALGFRAPYLRYEEQLYAAMEAAGFSYSSNRTTMWDVLEARDLLPSAYDSFQRAIELYDPTPIGERPSLPYFYGKLVEIPVSLPDDEILLDRLGGEKQGLVEKVWQRILTQSHRSGELFTIQLHPERTAYGARGLEAVLSQAGKLVPHVWTARLDEIADWWRARTGTIIRSTPLDDGQIRLDIAGPTGVTVLLRSVYTDAPTKAWIDGYQQSGANTLTVHTARRPFVGVSPATSDRLVSFMRQQGYIVESSEKSDNYSYYLDRPTFTTQQERSLLAQIEETDRPLVRLGRWPGGARSALAITGDIDALTIWDYGLRFLGR
jgi:peptidoglycan/xylan/chitin deacetylase (PgdA/CDA1 family)